MRHISGLSKNVVDMTSFKLKLLLILWALTISLTAAADNHIFFNGSPVLTINAEGNFDALSLGMEGEDGHRQIKQELTRSLELLYRPGSEIGLKVKAFKLDPDIGCSEPDVLQLVDDQSTDGVLSSTPLLAPLQKQPYGLTAAQRQIARAHLRLSLGQFKGISAAWRKQLVTQAEVVAIKLGALNQPSLVVSVAGSQADQTASVFMVLTPTHGGHYIRTMNEVLVGAHSDTDEYAGAFTLSDHIDVDGDGEEELIITKTDYESYSTRVYRRAGAKWLIIGGGAGGGC